MKNGNTKSLTPYLSGKGAWALALGTSIGWGSFIITSNTYLMQAGPAGSAFGMIIGAAVMIIIARLFHYMMTRYPDAGGAYSYAKAAFGYDYGFITAWFLIITYLAMFWANSTAIPLFARYFLGDVFRFGHMYSLFGYDIYAGEIILSVSAILLIMLICINSKKLTAGLMIILAMIFVAVIAICFAFAMAGIGNSGMTADPAFIPDSDALSQILIIASISPWAFIGFESISHSTEEFSFKRRKSFRVFVAVIITATLLYVMVTLLSVTAYPERYGSWLEYIGDLGNAQGLEAIPAFYAANHYMGSAGVTLLTSGLLAVIVTSLIGNMVALSRLFYALGKDGIWGKRMTALSKKSIPFKAIILISLISLAIPFIGRTALGWIVDVTTLGATVIYGFVSASALREAHKNGDRRIKGLAVAGIILMIVIAVLILAPGIIGSGNDMARESFILFALWSVIGFAVFRSVLVRDKGRRFGRSTIVWIVLLSLVMITSLVWFSQSSRNSVESAVSDISSYYSGENSEYTGMGDEEFLENRLGEMQDDNMIDTVIIYVMFAASIGIMISNYAFMQKKEAASEKELGEVRTAALTDTLTGVKNKLSFAEWKERMDSKTDSEYAVAVCDINGLKFVNDNYGHKAGDKLIKDASALVCKMFKHSPVFRIGGDEFAVILEGRDYADRYERLALLKRESETNIEEGRVVIAAGLSEYKKGSGETLQDVFDRADVLMYEEKQRLKSLGAESRD